ncbi:MAG: hypothetical protein O7G85_10650 [Planctomycetota bacterium]|nr:hypothetical protein [Planctomycetota bacterium]
MTPLYMGDTITIKLAGNFPKDSSITKITIYNNTIVDNEDAKDVNSEVGHWTDEDENSSGLDDIYYCEAKTKHKVTIEDIEDRDDDVKYWYAASGLVGGTSDTWRIDPELINKGRRNQMPV